MTAADPSSLRTFHKNPRQGDIPAIMASLRRHTQYKPITVNLGTYTDRPNEVLAGNHTLLAYRQLGEEQPDETEWRKIKVFWVDVDNDTAERIVVADNQTGQLGGFDEMQLARLVEGFEGDIEGLGFSDADAADLTALLQEQPGLPDASPGRRDDGLIDAKDMEQRQNEYEASANNRMVVLTMPIARFVWVQEQLDAARKQYNVETNTDAVIALLEAWSGEDAPAADAPPPEAPAPEDNFGSVGDPDGEIDE